MLLLLLTVLFCYESERVEKCFQWPIEYLQWAMHTNSHTRTRRHTIVQNRNLKFWAFEL